MLGVATQVDRLLDMVASVPPESRLDAPPRVGIVPVEPGVRRMVIFGGTFDPPHRAHVDLSMKAMKALNADAMLIVPAARSPHKDAGPTTSDADRVAMLELAYRGKPGVSICTLELERSSESDPSFTVDTLEALRRELGTGVQMRLLIGADQAAAFHRWREVDRILAIAPPAVLLRPPIDSLEELDKRLRQHWTPKQMAFWRQWIVPAPVSGISATNVRQSTQRTQGDLPTSVARYIEARGLYRGAPQPAHG
jgi:nicotinate-nucleotide adenylyltransferase